MKVEHWDQRNPPVRHVAICKSCGEKDIAFFNVCIKCAFKVPQPTAYIQPIIISPAMYQALKKEGYK
jgi:hypothetical protein